MKSFVRRVLPVALVLLLCAGFVPPAGADMVPPPVDDITYIFNAADLPRFEAPDGGEAVRVGLTEEQIAELLGLGHDFNLDIAVTGMDGLAGAELLIELGPLLEVGLQTLRFQTEMIPLGPHILRDASLTVPLGALRDMSSRADTIRIGLYEVPYGRERIVLSGDWENESDGVPIDNMENYYNYQYPLTLSFKYFTPPLLSARPGSVHVPDMPAVIQYFFEDDVINTHSLPRSWRQGDTMVAKICSDGVFGVYDSQYIEYNFLAGHWARVAFGFLNTRSVINGYPDYTFRPDQPITRAEFVVMLDRLLNIEPRENGLLAPCPDWDDIPDWAVDSAYTARVLGIVQGDGHGSFNPNAPIMRQEMFVMVYRAMRFGFPQGIPTGTPMAADSVDIAEWALDPIHHLHHMGIISSSHLSIRPLDAATRAEAAQILYNLLIYERNP